MPVSMDFTDVGPEGRIRIFNWADYNNMGTLTRDSSFTRWPGTARNESSWLLNWLIETWLKDCLWQLKLNARNSLVKWGGGDPKIWGDRVLERIFHTQHTHLPPNCVSSKSVMAAPSCALPQTRSGLPVFYFGQEAAACQPFYWALPTTVFTPWTSQLALSPSASVSVSTIQLGNGEIISRLDLWTYQDYREMDLSQDCIHHQT